MVDLVDRMVHSVTAPYARGESDVFKYWNQIMYGWRRVKGLRNAPNISFSKSDINMIVDDWGYDVISYGMIIIDLFWDERDVSPQNIAMIQSVVPRDYRISETDLPPST